ncbi:DUF4403 family protein [Pontibacter mangrovi]|uniref:DUF4403 family protein n=1 Tax=Pontibacter mangrovi TaxID=2589816 RepID=A0A501WBD3_9BACT|nr:DUF4403 family protein [Pontibacter mangrovi]TPE45364.1 DUF4403 family protein [Pontibacter mangrovi]
MPLHTLRKLPVLLLLIIAGFALPGCSGTEQLDTAAPTAAAAAIPAYTPRLSSVTVPVSISVAALEEKLNQEIAGILYQDTNLADDNLAVTVARNGHLSMRAEQDKVYFSVPLRVFAKGRWKWDPCKICPSIDKTEDTAFDIIIKTESRIGLTEDYKINTITSGNFVWGDTKPVLELGPLRIGLARFVEPALRQQMTSLSKQLDKELQSRLDVRKYIAEAWQQLQQPLKLDDNLNAWLSVAPQEVRMAPLLAHNGSLNTRLGLTSYITVSTNGKPQVQANKALPKLIIDSHMADDIQIGLTASIPYAHASKMVQEQVANQTYTFEEGKSQITVSEAAITPAGNQLVLMLDIDGKTKAGIFTKKISGKIYLRGTPYYNAETASIRVRDVAYDLDTRDKILSAANWLAQNRFEEMIQQQVSIPVQHELENARQMLQAMLDKQGQVNKSVLLRGSIKDITPENLYLTQDGIKAVVNARGTLTATVDKL